MTKADCSEYRIEIIGSKSSWCSKAMNRISSAHPRTVVY